MTEDLVQRQILAIRGMIDEYIAGKLDKQAIQAIESLAAMRNDRVLPHLYAVTMRAKGKVKTRAVQLLGDACRRCGYTQDDLEERIVTDMGLREDATMELDFGPRRFVVGFDELLAPFIRDETGASVKALPKGAKSDDPVKSEQAHAAWTAVREQVKLVETEERHRLEQAMCAEREWPAASFKKHFVGRRLLGRFARRLVFLASGTPFRIEQDGSFADVDDRPFALPDDARVKVAHPARLENAARWAEVLAEHGILQPFPQLDRPSVVLSAEDLAARLTRAFEGKTASGGACYGLKQRGWSPEGWTGCLVKQVTPDVKATLSLEPGITSFAGKPEDQTVGALALSSETFGALGPVARWELLRDLVVCTHA